MKLRFYIADKIWDFRRILRDKFVWNDWAGLRSLPNFICEMLDRIASYLTYGSTGDYP